MTAKEIRGKIAKVVEEEWREELEKKNSLGIYRRFKKEMKEEDYSGSLESMLRLKARTNSLNLGENSWQSNREICVGCSEEVGRVANRKQVPAQTQNRRNRASPRRIPFRRTRK